MHGWGPSALPQLKVTALSPSGWTLSHTTAPFVHLLMLPQNIQGLNYKILNLDVGLSLRWVCPKESALAATVFSYRACAILVADPVWAECHNLPLIIAEP